MHCTTVHPWIYLFDVLNYYNAFLAQSIPMEIVGSNMPLTKALNPSWGD